MAAGLRCWKTSGSGRPGPAVEDQCPLRHRYCWLRRTGTQIAQRGPGCWPSPGAPAARRTACRRRRRRLPYAPAAQVRPPCHRRGSWLELTCMQREAIEGTSKCPPAHQINKSTLRVRTQPLTPNATFAREISLKVRPGPVPSQAPGQRWDNAPCSVTSCAESCRSSNPAGRTS